MDYLQKNMLPSDGQEVYKSKTKKKETKKSLENFYEEEK